MLHSLSIDALKLHRTRSPFLATQLVELLGIERGDLDLHFHPKETLFPILFVLDIVTLEAWSPRELGATLEPHSIVVKLRGVGGRLRLVVEQTHPCCKGFVCAFKAPIVESQHLALVRA